MGYKISGGTRTAQVSVQWLVVVGPRNQTSCPTDKPHSEEIEHKFVRRDKSLNDHIIFRHGLNLVHLERLRGIV